MNGSKVRSAFCAAGTTAGARGRWRSRWRCSGSTNLMKAVAAPAGEPINVTTTRLARDTTDAQKLAALERGCCAAAPRLRLVAGAVGRHQPLPAHLAGDRPSVQRCRAEHPGRLPLGALGLAGLVRRERRSRARRNGTARAATASSRWSSSGSGSALERSRPAARAAIPPRPISTTRRSATRPAICARSISTRTS